MKPVECVCGMRMGRFIKSYYSTWYDFPPNHIIENVVCKKCPFYSKKNGCLMT